MTWLLVISILIVLVLISTLLSAAESALSELPRSELSDLADDHPKNRFLPGIAQNAEGHEHSVKFARAGSETIATALLAVWLTDRMDGPWLALLITAIVMLLVHFLLSGSSARSIGHAHPQATLRAVSWLVRGVRVITGILADLLTAIGDSVTPSRTARSGSLSSEEQLLSMVDEATEDDVLQEEDRELIHSIFDFSDRLVREVMVARTDMVTIDAETTLNEALTELLDAGFSRAPIVGRDSDDIRGVAYQKDLSREILRGSAPAQGTVATLARPATFVPESLNASELLRRMQRESTHFAIVIDEYGGVAGLVTIEDLIEELVGEISDEHDRDTDDVELLPDGRMRVSSRMSTSDLGELLDIEIDDEDVDSVGGLVSKELGKIPKLGDRVVVHGLELTADRVGRRHRVTEISVRMLGENEDKDAWPGGLEDSLTRVLDDREESPHGRLYSQRQQQHHRNQSIAEDTQ
ncbi:MAG: hemolysin family protein [Gulosibacter sp.]|uniref:hemolysin family protein n=1 Tax=Gulosibacter sp. TaxID=2817531 RepID=UPI003F8E551F